jgi:hypothetical protein
VIRAARNDRPPDEGQETTLKAQPSGLRLALIGGAALACLGVVLLIPGCGGKDEAANQPPPEVGGQPGMPMDPAAGGMPGNPGMPGPTGPGGTGMMPAPGMPAEMPPGGMGGPGGMPGMGGPGGMPGMGGPGGMPGGGGAGGAAPPAGEGAAPAAGPPPLSQSRPNPFSPLDKPIEPPPREALAPVVRSPVTPIRPIIAPVEDERPREAQPDVPPGLRTSGILWGPTVKAILQQEGEKGVLVQPGETITIQFGGPREVVVTSIGPDGVLLRDTVSGREYFAPLRRR